MFCPECGTNNSDDAIYCQNCGLNLRKSRVQTQQMPPKQQYESPEAPIRSQAYSPILDGLEEAHISDNRDSISAMYYIIALVFWPLGFVLWAIHRQNKPESSKNLLVSTLAGFFLMLMIFVL